MSALKGERIWIVTACQTERCRLKVDNQGSPSEYAGCAPAEQELILRLPFDMRIQTAMEKL